MPLRCQAVFQGATLLPEDRFINTFHFLYQASVPLVDAIELVHGAVSGFFLNSYGRSANVAGYMSNFIEDEWQTIVYNLDEPEGSREPNPFTWDMPTRSGEGLPEEVAVCLSLHGAPPITPRRRGRVYIGPLMAQPQVIANAASTVPSRVNVSGAQSMGTQLAVAATKLMIEPNIQWCIRSVTPVENFVPIAGGYIDNAFDIQRRRGPVSSARRAWPLPGDEVTQ